MASTTETRGGCARVAHVLRTPLTCLLGITGPLEARIELGLSQPEMGIQLGNAHPNGHGGKPFNRSTVAHWENGDYKMTGETQAAYQTLLRNWIHDRTDGRMTVRVRFGRRWRPVPLMVCECGRAFRFKRITQTKCRRCRRAK